MRKIKWTLVLGQSGIQYVELYLQSIRWDELLDEYYNGVHLSEYYFCEYSNNKDKYINTFYFIDTEKINRIKYFLKENTN